jgi:hypothetical protein
MAIGPSRRGRWSKPNRGPDRHRRQTALEEEALRPKLAGCRNSADSIERPLKETQQSSKREGPRWIGEQPFSETNSLTVDDPYA